MLTVNVFVLLVPIDWSKEERYSRVPRLSDTPYSAKGEMEICKQRSGIEMRHQPAISIYGYVGGR